MRTAKEMYDYCIENGYGHGFNKHNSLKHFAVLEANLKPDEEVLFPFIGLHNYQSISKHDNNFAYAVTDRRFLMAQKKVIGQNVQSVRHDYFNDITFSTGVAMGIITIDTIKEQFNIAVNKQDGRNIYDALNDLLFGDYYGE